MAGLGWSQLSILWVPRPALGGRDGGWIDRVDDDGPDIGQPLSSADEAFRFLVRTAGPHDTRLDHRGEHSAVGWIALPESRYGSHGVRVR